jgi:RNA polymerase sigma-70 factor (ECF subfamily)
MASGAQSEIGGNPGDALLRRAAGGDRDAFSELFQREAGLLLGVARRMVRRPEIAEDIVQEAFVAAWRSAAQFDPSRGTARAWLIASVRNRALNSIRDGARLDYHEPDSLETLDERHGDAMDAFRRLPDSEALRDCLGRLDEPKREAILLCYVVGMSHAEAAARIKAPLGTVKAWVRRGMLSLQECLS